MKKRIVFFLLKALFIATVFTLLFRPQTFGFSEEKFKGISLDGLAGALEQLTLANAVFWFSFAALAKLLGISAGILRWRLLLRAQGLRIPFWYLVKCWFMGRAIGLWLPSTVGLDGYRLVESAAYTGEAIRCATVIAVEKLIGFIALGMLVFLTLPRVLTLFKVNVPMLAIVLAGLLGFITVSLLLLLNPRVVQVLASVLPVPGALRGKIDKLSAALTAYAGHRATLLLALLLGLGIHLGICLMYFGTAMAISGGHAAILDILFVSPLVIVGSIIAPTVSGMGVREVGFRVLLGAKYGTEQALLFGHMGLWLGEVLPFLLSIPLLLFATRPKREEFLSEADSVRAKASHLGEKNMHLPQEAIREYRARLLNTLLAGMLGGLVAGALVGLAEAGWIVRSLGGLAEYAAFWWGPLVYGVLFGAAGLGVAVGLAFVCLLFDRFLKPQTIFILALGLFTALAVLVIGQFRFQRDVLAGHAMSLQQSAMIAASALGGALALAVAAWLALRWVRTGRTAAVASGFGAFTVLVAAGAVVSGTMTPVVEEHTFQPAAQAKGPNIIFVAVDALRADRLGCYSKDAAARTPNLDGFARDAVRFESAFSQASWTKPSFATMFSGLYPSMHGATSKTSMLQDNVTTFPELLLGAGYYTKGFSNNPNITSLFHFDQGFADYVDLKPSLYFGASASSSKLAVYEVLRRARQMALAKLPGGHMVVTDFYQPAEVVTQTALDWLDSPQRPVHAPFFLFLHYMETHDPFMDWTHPGVGYARVRMENPDPDKYLEAMSRAYDGEIEHLDQNLGPLFEGLRQRGLYEDTVIVFTSDHGEEFYDHRGWWHGQTLYDELTHVPLLIKLPGHIKGGEVNSDFARHIDLAPTCLSLAGVEKDAAMPGHSLLDLTGAFGNQDTSYSYAENDFEGIVLQAIRIHAAKTIHANEGNKRNLKPVELYDMAADPKEQQNLAGQSDPRESELSSLLANVQRSIKENAKEPEKAVEISDELKSQLEALGYVNAE